MSLCLFFFNCSGFVQIIYVHVNYTDRVLLLLSFLHVLYTIKLINGFPINFLWGRPSLVSDLQILFSVWMTTLNWTPSNLSPLVSHQDISLLLLKILALSYYFPVSYAANWHVIKSTHWFLNICSVPQVLHESIDFCIDCADRIFLN